MTNIRTNKTYSWVKLIAIFAATWVVAGPALALDSLVSEAGVKPMPVAFAPMQPVFQTAPALPKPRPDPALAYSACRHCRAPQQARIKRCAADLNRNIGGNDQGADRARDIRRSRL